MDTQRLAAGPETIATAAALLRGGNLVAFPTETVYGLGADARDAEAVARLYEAKGRPRFNPLIAHVPTIEAAWREGVFNAAAAALAEAFWPGPLTLVVPVRTGGSICALARAGLDSVGLRVPAHPIARALLEAVDRPVVAPSANRSGRISPTRAAHVLADLDGRIDAVLDGGDAAVGVESTIVGCLEGHCVLLRPGGIPTEAIEACLGMRLASGQDDAVLKAPGMMASHYAPRLPVRLRAGPIARHEAVLDFGGQLEGASAVAYLDLSRSGDLHEAAARLFDALHRLDAAGASGIAVAPIPDHGLGAAINDRLRRAAAPRPG
ncbi:L-threonylcarbamoyladenylate synthase [Lichenihabitans sp. Uapishka_5]|uniref:L-threonylcarbamoyladenylate synthase n=1 Tax=Lichenihabitans sp. Uapishka_5 TaxID=3037302 RepID=UPI0029E7D029|nr:L-threonylcarbamoyladenylate synthase [Lichenihabitans sp. Uapishka_5]MDX7949937.1 L-threonylcarbamoyladenylate synthase [Lichenihabitans sp. Uapishka_5]